MPEVSYAPPTQHGEVIPNTPAGTLSPIPRQQMPIEWDPRATHIVVLRLIGDSGRLLNPGKVLPVVALPPDTDFQRLCDLRAIRPAVADECMADEVTIFDPRAPATAAEVRLREAERVIERQQTDLTIARNKVRELEGQRIPPQPVVSFDPEILVEKNLVIDELRHKLASMQSDQETLRSKLDALQKEKAPTAAAPAAEMQPQPPRRK